MPKDTAKTLVVHMDSGTKYEAEVDMIKGGGSKYYGVNILIKEIDHKVGNNIDSNDYDNMFIEEMRKKFIVDNYRGTYHFDHDSLMEMEHMDTDQYNKFINSLSKE